jgi:hypothetical protein
MLAELYFVDMLHTTFFFAKKTCIPQRTTGITIFWQVSERPSGPEDNHTAVQPLILAKFCQKVTANILSSLHMSNAGLAVLQ